MRLAQSCSENNYMETTFLVFAVITGFVLPGCSQGKKASDSEAFAISDTLMRYITFDTVKNSPVKGKLKLTGKVLPNEANVIDIFPLVGGSVENVFVELGEYVPAGKVLAVLKSGEIADLEQQLNAAQSNLSIAEKNLAVAEDM